MQREKVTFKSLRYNLVGIIDIPHKIPAPGVILFHGLSNSKEDCPMINETADMLVKEGFIAFRFDFYGSGESPGLMRDKTMSVLEKNARDALRFLSNDKRVTEIGLWGRSLGGTIVACIGSHPRVKASIILTGGVILEKTFAPHFEKLKKMEKEFEKKGKKLPGTGYYKGPYELGDIWFKELPEIERRIMNSLKRMSHVLVLATTPDIKVPLENATTIINTVREPKEIHIFENIEHDYRGVEKIVLELEKKWFRTYLMGVEYG